MRPRRPLVSLSLSVVFAGCGIADFDISQPIPEQRVQGSGIPAPLASLFPLPLDIDLTAEIEKRTTGPIDSITLSSLTLVITPTARTGSDTDDWSFVDEIHVFVRSSAAGSSLPRVEIASITMPGAVTTLTFVVDDSVNLVPYVDGGSVIDSSGSGRIPADDISYDGTGVSTVHPL